MKRSRTVFETRSDESGRIRVVDYRSERRLLVSGDTLSVYPLDGDWTRVRREYWWHALVAARLPPRPSTLLIGLGGGTQLHLIQALRRPRRITVIERDPAIIRVASEWFALDSLGSIEFLCADAAAAAGTLAAGRRRFDFIMEDATYAQPLEQSWPLVRTLVGLVSSRGALVINRHWRTDAHRLAAALTPLFEDVRLRYVRRGAENALVCANRPRAAMRRRPSVGRPRAQARGKRL